MAAKRTTRDAVVDVAAPAAKRQRRSRFGKYGDIFDYENLGELGEGSFGEVFKAKDLCTGEIVAIKSLRTAGGEKPSVDNLLPEARYLTDCYGHPSIVEIRDVACDKVTGDAFLVMEYVGKSLRDVMRDDRIPFLEARARRMMRQLLSGVKRIHDAGLMHRDLKPGNILVGDGGDLKICDFGLARSLGDAQYTTAGTLWYMAPEMLLGERAYDGLVDTWSLGCIMAELLTAEPLFPGSSETDQLRKIFAVLGVPDKASWPDYESMPLAASMPCAGWRGQQHSSLGDLFLKEGGFKLAALSQAGFEVLSGLLTCNPKKRLTAKAALRHRWFAEGESRATEKAVAPALCKKRKTPLITTASFDDSVFAIISV